MFVSCLFGFYEVGQVHNDHLLGPQTQGLGRHSDWYGSALTPRNFSSAFASVDHILTGLAIGHRVRVPTTSIVILPPQPVHLPAQVGSTVPADLDEYWMMTSLLVRRTR